jgi:hypothetical protein
MYLAINAVAAAAGFVIIYGLNFFFASRVSSPLLAVAQYLTDQGGGKRRDFNATDTLNHGFSLMLSVVQWRYGSAFSHRRRLPAYLDIFSLSPLRPFRLLHMFQIRTSVVGRRPRNTLR